MAHIRLHNVHISFPLYEVAGRSLKKRLIEGSTGGRIGNSQDSGGTVVQALEGVSAQFEHGDRVALIGHNGAGKTTLLRVLAGIYEPALGTVDVQGQIAPLFDIGLGMNPEATGYDNILLRGLYLGLSKREMRKRAPAIAEFTELGDFLDLPMRTYSLGMRMRLGFAVCTEIDPDILLLDEGLSAGDASFVKKADARLREFWDKAAVIVLASHSETMIRNLCNKAILIEHGRVVCTGTVESVLERYKADSSSVALEP
ncbi:ABC transporter ATP-binding protein [Rhabdochromatium marinum]|uniref:ABC transporter ATP-binding protein n=1 Tax=Rhabdochromatium marinum TaxID=48729 RepID=UPI0019032DB5|nr:ABC transporter ATP-binding protein [Rhabdochromatium marinum]MBK1650253.1 sugar ABC transporter ATP-binding protein [Rhabdochromatium marinum]